MQTVSQPGPRITRRSSDMAMRHLSDDFPPTVLHETVFDFPKLVDHPQIPRAHHGRIPIQIVQSRRRILYNIMQNQATGKQHPA